MRVLGFRLFVLWLAAFVLPSAIGSQTAEEAWKRGIILASVPAAQPEQGLAYAGREYSETVEDLPIAVPGGTVYVTRSYARGRWRVRVADELYVMGPQDPDTPPAPVALVLNGTAFTPGGQPLADPPPGTKVGLHLHSRAPAGVYRPQPSSLAYIEKRVSGSGEVTYFWTDGHGEERTFNAAGRLIARSYRGVPIATFVHTTDPARTNSPVLLRSILDSRGRLVMTLLYDSHHRLVGARDDRDTSIPEADRPTVSYGYASGPLTEVITPDGVITTYGYQNGRLHTITTDQPALADRADVPAQPAEELRHVVTLDYQLSTSTPKFPLIYDFRAPRPNPIYSNTSTYEAPYPPPLDPGEFMILGMPRYGFAITAFLNRLSHSTGESESYVYKFEESTRTYISRVRDAAGREEETATDQDGKPVALSKNGRPIYSERISPRVRERTIDAYVVRTEYDEFQRVTRRVNPDGGVESFAYHPTLNRVTRHVDPLGLITVSNYDSLGNLLDTIETLPLPGSPEATRTVALFPPYLAPGSTPPATAPTRTTNREYVSGTRRLAKQTDPDGRITVYDYYDALSGAHRGDLLKRKYFYYPGTPVAEREARVETYDYDLYGRLHTRTDALGRTTTYYYDKAHRLAREVDPLGVETRYVYQGRNLREVERGYVAARTTPTAAPEQRGRRTRFAYDSRSRLRTEFRVAANGDTYPFRRLTYDITGRLKTETNGEGQTTTYGYDADGNLDRVEAPGLSANQPSVTTYVFNRQGRVTQEIDPIANTSAAERARVGIKRTTYGANGLPATVTEADGTAHARTTTFRYDLRGNLTERTVSGQELDSSGTLQRIAYSVTYHYDAFGRQVAIKGDAAYARALTLDPAGRTLTDTDARGLATDTLAGDYQTTYDYRRADGLLADGLLGTVTLGPRTLATYSYDLLGNQLSLTDGGGRHRHYRYDALNRVIAESIPFLPGEKLGSGVDEIPADWWEHDRYVLTRSSYNRFGEVESVVRPTYDPLTGLTTYAETDYTYDDYGRIDSQTTPAGLTVLYGYDLADHPTSIRYPVPTSSGATGYVEERFTRNPANAALVDAHTDRAGYLRRFAYDRALRMVEEINSQGGLYRATYDPLGRLDSLRRPDGFTTKALAYTLRDQPLLLQHPDHTDAAPRLERATYDPRGRLRSRSGTGGVPAEYDYDEVGNLNTLKTHYGPPPGTPQTTTWLYNELNRPVTKTYPGPAPRTWIYTYDGAGQLASRTDGLGQKTDYTYNRHGLIEKIDYSANPVGPAAADVTFAYDQQGRRLTMSDGTGQSRWTYDAAGRPLTEFQPLSGRTLTFTHDAHDQRTGLAVSAAGAAAWNVAYTYDAPGRLSTVRDSRHPATSPFSYAYPRARTAADLQQLANLPPLDEGRQDKQTLATPYGQVLTTTRDVLGRVQTIAARATNDPASALLVSHGYTYDEAGLREIETGTAAAIPGEPASAPFAWSRTHTYDHYRQVSTTTTTGTATDTHGYTYDEIGNRLTATFTPSTGASATSTAYTPNSLNQYASLTISGGADLVPTYDHNGNQTTGRQAPNAWSAAYETATYAYDQENRLVSATTLLHTETYTYDGFGRRVQRSLRANGNPSPIETVRYVYDGWRVLEELDASGVVQRGYVLGLDLTNSWTRAGGIGGLLAMLTPGGGSYTAAAYVHDGNGNVSALLAANGSVAARYRYSPFGEVLAQSNTALAASNRYRFSAKEQDAFTGFCYYGFRYYNPSTGRWLSRDPIGERGGRNLYGMVGNNPIGRWDFLGLKWSFEDLLKGDDLAKLNKLDDAIKRQEEATAKMKNDLDKGIPIDPSRRDQIINDGLDIFNEVNDILNKALPDADVFEIIDNAFPNGLADILTDGEKLSKIGLGIACAKLRAMTDECDANECQRPTPQGAAKCDKIRDMKNKICGASGRF
jgi:RHS repeat-associated protein